MIKYLYRRINLFLATSLMLMLVLFVCTHLFPVELSIALSGIKQPSLLQGEIIQAQYHLDSNLLRQFFAYLEERLTGNLGYSLTSGQTVTSELGRVLPATLELVIVTVLLAISFGLPLGILASLSRRPFITQSIMFFTLTGYSIPVFWLGLTLSLWFGVQLGWLPIAGQISLLYEIPRVTGFMLIDTLMLDNHYGVSAFYDALKHMILPAVTLAIFPFTVVVRMTYTSLNTVMQQTYIRAAEARGLSTWRILRRHALPTVMLSILKSMGLMLGAFVSYTIVVEAIFSWPGVGAWLVQGIYQRDYTVIQGGVMSVALLIIVISIIIDVLFTAMNPISRKEIYGVQ